MPAALTLSELEQVVQGSWSAETSDDPAGWRPENPARGQCGTSSFVLQALLGGHVVVARVEGTDPQVHHAWNRLPSGVEIDLARDQFTEPPTLTECVIPETQLEALFGAQARLLLERVERALAQRA